MIPATLSLDDEFMVGTDLLAAPVVRSGQTSRLVYLPKGTWYDFWTRSPAIRRPLITVDAPLAMVPLFTRGGSILPSGPEMNFVDEKGCGSVCALIFTRDEQGRAAASLTRMTV